MDPWHVRGVEVRGHAEALEGQPPPRPGFTGEIIRIHPRTIFSWGLDEAHPFPVRRNIA